LLYASRTYEHQKTIKIFTYLIHFVLNALKTNYLIPCQYLSFYSAGFTTKHIRWLYNHKSHILPLLNSRSKIILQNFCLKVCRLNNPVI